MDISTPPLYMVRLLLRSDCLIDLARRRGLPLRDLDTGYLLHSQLKELFQDQAPSPFSSAGISGRFTAILAYSDLESNALENHARAFADPSVFASCDWERTEHKEMPSSWPEGQVLGFEVRVCPVVRVASSATGFRKGAEIDAFLKVCTDAGENVLIDREEVYRKWIQDQFDRRSGVELLEVSLKGFRIENVFRRQSNNHKGRILSRPDALISGKLRISSSGDFVQVLRTGVGRHRAFGYGMLLLRPAA